MKNVGVLIFIDGTICDDRQRIDLFGTEEFYNEHNVMNDKPVAGSVQFVNTLAQKYNIIYFGARPESTLAVTKKWLSANGFPKGKVFLSAHQNERLEITKTCLSNENIILGIGDRWDDNQLHLILGCKSVIVREYHGDWNFVSNYI